MFARKESLAAYAPTRNETVYAKGHARNVTRGRHCTHVVVNFTSNVNRHVILVGAVICCTAVFGCLEVKSHDNGLAVCGAGEGLLISLLRVCVQHSLEAASRRCHCRFQAVDRLPVEVTGVATSLGTE